MSFPTSTNQELPHKCKLWILQYVEKRDLKSLAVTNKAWRTLVSTYSPADWTYLLSRPNGAQIRDITAPLVTFGKSQAIDLDCSKLSSKGLAALQGRLPRQMCSLALRNIPGTVPVHVVCRLLAGVSVADSVTIDGWATLSPQDTGILLQSVPSGAKHICVANCPSEHTLLLLPGPTATDERLLALVSGLESELVSPSRRKVNSLNLENCFGLTDAIAERLGQHVVAHTKAVCLAGCAGFSEKGMMLIFDDVPGHLESLDVRNCPGFTDKVADQLSLQFLQPGFDRLLIQNCDALTPIGTQALLALCKRGAELIAIGNPTYSDHDIVSLLDKLGQLAPRQITISGDVGPKTRDKLASLQYTAATLSDSQLGSSNWILSAGSNQQKEPSPPRSASNSPPRDTIRIEFAPARELIPTDDLDELKRRALTGDLPSSLKAAQILWEQNRHLKSDGHKERLEEMAKWCLPAAKAELPAAQYLMFQICKGQDYKGTAWVEWLQKAAGGNHLDALFELGQCYQLGRGGCPTAPSKAFNLYVKAGNGGHSKAMAEVARCYEAGIGTRKCETSAFKWKERAARAGCSSSLYGLGLNYLFGIRDVVNQDREEAVKLFKEAVALGNDHAKVILAQCYCYGWGTYPAPKKAYELLESVVAAPLPSFNFGRQSDWYEACVQLAVCTAEGIGTPANPAKAKDILEKMMATPSGAFCSMDRAATAEAKLLLGIYHRKGLLETRDDAQAFSLFEEALSGDSTFYLCATKFKAKYWLGICHFEGWGTPQNKQLAYQCFHAAHLQVPDAAYYAGLCLEKGWGTAKKRVIANVRYECAITNAQRFGHRFEYLEDAKAGAKRTSGSDSDCTIL